MIVFRTNKNKQKQDDVDVTFTKGTLPPTPVYDRSLLSQRAPNIYLFYQPNQNYGLHRDASTGATGSVATTTAEGSTRRFRKLN